MDNYYDDRETNDHSINVRKYLSQEEISSIDNRVEGLLNNHLKMTIYDEICDSESITKFLDV